MEDDRIVLAGSRASPDCTFTDCEIWMFVEHIALDGTVLAIDAPDHLLAAGDLGYESVVATGRHPDGSLVTLAADEDRSASIEHIFVARFPW